MVTIGDLSQAQADSMKFPKLLTDSPSYSPPGLSSGCSTTSTEPWASYLMTQVCGELTGPTEPTAATACRRTSSTTAG